MDEDENAHYALQIAVTILRERCQLFQRRITVLEEENINLKSMCQSHDDTNQNSLSTIDSLKQQIASIDEQNRQLQSKMKIISQENQQLWANLGKLSHTNKSLGSHLNKINNTLSQHVTHHQPLIRSKTFTQDKPQVEDLNEKLRLDLEDISLKLINSMNVVKNEMDSLVQDITDVEMLDNNVITSSLGFTFEDESDDIIEDLKIILEEFNHVKHESEKQNVFLKESLKNIRNMKINSQCDKCSKDDNFELKEQLKPSLDSGNTLEDQQAMVTSAADETKLYKTENVCPICSQQFPKEVPFLEFVSHVEKHYMLN